MTLPTHHNPLPSRVEDVVQRARAALDVSIRATHQNELVLGRPARRIQSLGEVANMVPLARGEPGRRRVKRERQEARAVRPLRRAEFTPKLVVEGCGVLAVVRGQGGWLVRQGG